MLLLIQWSNVLVSVLNFLKLVLCVVLRISFIVQLSVEKKNTELRNF